LLLQPNDAAFALYFTEFDTNHGQPYDNTLPGQPNKGGGVSSHRSMLQLARVRFNTTSGWLHGNRSEPFVVHLQPPSDAAPPPERVLPTVLAVARSEAATIALAEINRWMPLGSGRSATPPGKLQRGLMPKYKLAMPSYAERAEGSAEACVSTCSHTANCSAVVYCAKRGKQQYCDCPAVATNPRNPAAASVPPPPSGGCCFMVTDAADRAFGGSCRQDAHSNCDGSGCAGWSSASVLGLMPPTPGGAGDYPGDAYQSWRDPVLAPSFFTDITQHGSGSALVWTLRYTSAARACGSDSGTGAGAWAGAYAFAIVVAANGTVTALHVNGTRLQPLQFARVVE
jgi:hypothetical protein